MIKELQKCVKKIIGAVTSYLPHVHNRIEYGLTVFVYHDVSNKPSKFTEENNLVVTPDTFEKQINWIKNNFEIIHPSIILSNQQLPKRAAIISFDDGYRGTFNFGLPLLKKLNIPAIIFLNMQPIIFRKPILSAISYYLSETEPSFDNFCKDSRLKPPYHLSLNPSVLKNYIHKNHDIPYDEIIKYQGEFVDIETLKKWDGNPLVCFGNHLFEHWNAIALTSDELKNQYLNNEYAMSKFASKVNLFAFTNGQPNTCFSMRDIELLNNLGVSRVFSAVGGVNKGHKEFLLGRIPLLNSDMSNSDLWFRIFKGLQSVKLVEDTRR